jgi:hypothetical protein
MVIPIELSASISHEEICDFNLARIDLTEEKISWIKKMAGVVKDNDVAYIADYDSSPEYFNKDDSEDPPEITPYDGSTECDMIMVRKYSFFWKGLIKHTSIHIDTDSMSLEALDELIKFYNEEPLNNMPIYMNDDNYSKREIALRRMKGEKGS